MKILIIDDEKSTRKIIAHLLHQYSKDLFDIIEADCIASGVKQINKEKPDIVLLDISLPDGSGFELLKQTYNKNFKLIFITAHEKFVFKAYEFSAFGFILKPIDPTKLLNTIEKAKRQIEMEKTSQKLNAVFTQLNSSFTENKTIEIITSGNTRHVNINEIIGCESDDDNTWINISKNIKILAYGSISDFEKRLESYGFYRIHPSYLINIKYIDYYSKADGGRVVMKDNSILPVSKVKNDSLLKILEMI